MSVGSNPVCSTVRKLWGCVWKARLHIPLWPARRLAQKSFLYSKISSIKRNFFLCRRTNVWPGHGEGRMLLPFSLPFCVCWCANVKGHCFVNLCWLAVSISDCNGAIPGIPWNDLWVRVGLLWSLAQLLCSLYIGEHLSFTDFSSAEQA